MSYTYTATIKLGSAQTGLTLKAALTSAGTIHAVHRDLTGFSEIGGGMYEWTYAGIPDGYRGSAVYYVGTLGVAADFSGVTLKDASAVAPQETENADVKTSSLSFSTLTQADVRTAVGLAAANLDTQLAAIAAFVDTEVALVLTRIGTPAGASLSIDVAAVKTDTTAIAVQSVRFATMIELDGAVYRYTANALELAPSGGDILATDVPNGYASGTVGYIIGHLGSGSVTFVSPLNPRTGTLTLVRGDAYKTAIGTAIDVTDVDSGWPTLTDATITFELGDGSLVAEGEVITATGASKQVRLQLSSTATESVGEGIYDANVVATFAGTGTDDDRVTLRTLLVTVVDREDS